VLPFCLLDPLWEGFRWPAIAELASKRVIVCTCIAAGYFLRTTVAPFDRPLAFSHVLIDEAGQAPLPEALLPLCLADPHTGTCMLAGDPQQLGPVIRSKVAAAGGLSVSLLERLVAYYRNLPHTLPARRQCSMLLRNYRSHARLLQLPSDLFYGGTLLACASTGDVEAPRWSELPRATSAASEEGEQAAAGGTEPACNTLLYGVLGQEVCDGSAATFFNPQEAEVVVSLVASLIEEHQRLVLPNPVTGRQIGVICTCRAQVGVGEGREVCTGVDRGNVRAWVRRSSVCGCCCASRAWGRCVWARWTTTGDRRSAWSSSRPSALTRCAVRHCVAHARSHATLPH